MFTQLKSLGLFGLNAFSVDVEVSMNRGKPQMEIVGLPDTSVRESRERIRSALSSLSIALPARLITVNLAPADVKKIGTMHDLAILLGILVCMERIPAQPASRCFIGEVSLSGLVRSVSGVLPMALLAAQNGVTELYVPAENASEASAAGIPVYGVHSVGELIAHLNEDTGPAIRPQEPYTPQPEEYEEMLDFADVKGQQNGNCRSRRTQCPDDRQPRQRQEHACQADPVDPAGNDCRGVHGNHADLFHCRLAGRQTPADDTPPVPFAAPHHFRSRSGGRRDSAPSGGDFPCP